MNVRRIVKCGYCGQKRNLWADRGNIAPPVRMMRKLPNGLECCPGCYPVRVAEREREEAERDRMRTERADRFAHRAPNAPHRLAA